MKKHRRIPALALALILCLGLLPSASAFYESAAVGQRTIISAANYHSAAIDKNGSLWMWGSSQYGTLGNGGGGNARDGWFGDIVVQSVPVKVLDNVVSVSCGDPNGIDKSGHTAAIKTDGSLWTWGRNNCGQLGNGTTTDSSVPVKVMDDVAAVHCGEACTVAIKTDGSLWAWGDPIVTMGQSDTTGYFTHPEGRSNAPAQSTPVKIMDDVVAARAEWRSGGCALTADGTVWDWSRTAPVKATTDVEKKKDRLPDRTVDPSWEGLRNVVALSSYRLAVTADGGLWSCGDNSYGQVGNGVVSESLFSVKPPVRINLGMPTPVRLSLNGGLGGSTLWTGADGTVQVPVNPTRKGYTFGGWYSDEALTKPWNFNDKVTGSLTLYAKWVSASSSADTTGQSGQAVTLNGRPVNLQGYTLKAANGGDVTYVKLRDIAALLEDTGAKFNVDWRGGAIYVDTGKAYTTKNGTELKAIQGTDGSYRWNTAPVLFDGETRALEGIVITDAAGGGHTFFKLRDLGAALDFTVDWSAEKGVSIETE